MKEYRLIKWYPSLVSEWRTNNFPIVVVEREDGYHLHPSLKGMTRVTTINKQEVERNEDFWEELTTSEKQVITVNKELNTAYERYRYSSRKL